MAKRPLSKRRVLGITGILPLCLLLLSGCMQVETRIKLNPDGSAIVTERLQYSRRLLDFVDKQGKDALVAVHLGKEAAQKRAHQIAQGAVLSRHEVRDGENGARESVAVYNIPDFNEIRYVSPVLAAPEFQKRNVIHARIGGAYKQERWKPSPGLLVVSFGTKRVNSKPAPPQALSPARTQIYRELGPVFRDVLKGFKVRVVFESYAPLLCIRTYGRYAIRGYGTGVKEFDLIDFSFEDLDNWGNGFLKNEEIMLELLRGNFRGANLTTHTKAHAGNMTLPIFHGGLPRICFKPSRPLFDKYFKGKTLDYSYSKKGTRPASWEKIGHK